MDEIDSQLKHIDIQLTQLVKSVQACRAPLKQALNYYQRLSRQVDIHEAVRDALDSLEALENARAKLSDPTITGDQRFDVEILDKAIAPIRILQAQLMASDAISVALAAIAHVDEKSAPMVDASLEIQN